MSPRKALDRLPCWAWGLYGRTLSAAARAVQQAPLPVWLLEALRRVAQALPALPADVSLPDLHALSSADPDYALWLQRHAFDGTKAREASARLAEFRWRPLISILMPVRDPDPRHLELALASVEAQIYPAWELCIADDASTNPTIPAFLEEYAAARRGRVKLVRLPRSGHIAGATNAALAQAAGEFVAFLDHDDELSPDALVEVAAVLQDDPTADVIYSDHDLLDESGRFSPRFKPDWSPELLLSYMYFGHLRVYRAALVRAVGGLRAGFEGADDYDLALRIVEQSDRIRHIPKILYHWRAAPASMARTSAVKPYSFESGRRAVEEALQRRRIPGSAVRPDFAQRAGLGLYKIRFHSTVDIPVTIIIPTRDKLELLRACIESIRQKTTHRAYEILVVDNASREPATLEYLARSPHRVLCFEDGFNFAAMNNLGVEACRTEYFVLLNNDTLVISPEWLDELIGYAQRPGVGAVGGKLLYPDGRIQHAGVILGTHGLAGHAFQPRLDRENPLEYEWYAHVARNYLAVTAACLLSRKTIFREVGGFNDRDLKVAWNDVDFCLRLREKGYRVVFNPYALLYHLESQSRGDDKDPAEITYMLKLWRHYVDNDPFYNRNLSRRDSEFRIKTDPDEERSFYYRDFR